MGVPTGSLRSKKSKRPSSGTFNNPMDPSPPAHRKPAAAGWLRKGFPWRRRTALLPAALLVGATLLLLFLALKTPTPEPSRSQFSSFRVVNEFPHDPGAFTQGLVYGGNNTLFESTGLYGKSSVRHVLLSTVVRRLAVRYNGHEVPYLNELEYIGGEVWANVWQTDCIARISPRSGVVLGWVLLHELRKGLLASGHKAIEVLNGIAWDEEGDRLFVTGKLWPKLYEIKLQPMNLGVSLDRNMEDLCLPRRA